MKIDFEFNTPHGLFRDALHLPDDHAFSNNEIQLIKEKRVDDWIATVTAVSATEDLRLADFNALDGVKYAKVV